MSHDPHDPRIAGWPPASRRRQALAIYLDYLLIGAPWTIVTAAVERFWPGMSQISLPLKLVVFAVMEMILLRKFRWSPGQYCLGIVDRSRTPFAASAEPLTSQRDPLVDPWLLTHERWWTILFGVLAILDGAKGIARWTMWHAPLPLMGTQLPFEVSVAARFLTGVVQVVLGAAALRLMPVARPIGLALAAFILADTLLSWRLLPAWIEQAVIARRAFFGGTPRPGEIEAMQMLMPVLTLALACLGALWVFAVGHRVSRARAADPSLSGG